MASEAAAVEPEPKKCVIPDPPEGLEGSGVYQELRQLENKCHQAYDLKVQAASIQAEMDAFNAFKSDNKDAGVIGQTEVGMEEDLSVARDRLLWLSGERTNEAAYICAKKKDTSVEIAAIKRNSHTLRRRLEGIAIALDIPF